MYVNANGCCSWKSWIQKSKLNYETNHFKSILILFEINQWLEMQTAFRKGKSYSESMNFAKSVENYNVCHETWIW